METQIIKGKKINMTQVFLDTGVLVPVTLVTCSIEVTADLENKNVEVTGISKGKGFSGVMKKWNFKGSMATRGQSDKPRAAGSIGGQTPSRVFKGKKMAGRMGNSQITVKGLRIVKVYPERKELLVSGPVPGARNSDLKIKVL
ncbi:50S ribosomal protein L3 [candidate division WWE3 bacterium RIFOXYC1_FULL_39_7]|uniref:Large ribosomal subunit protein uL3 n=2 Tax=Katanobacteria TaxID=422282 RepID=A0A1F4X4G5_UNCKA|nr:MAG: 50S ribosomal protein L3 [candidate division WWE3 bacterium RIFOXYC1_FULL_39_7]OGC76469.1 MAG: 50S ribosomal protein L3 [candidate division WWE3 bacterium RIFOXYD1_FULL_39_9]